MKPEDFEFKSQYKKEVIKMINNFRGKGATFKEISKKLNALEFTTFSGEGKWHAQSVHRICSK